MGKEEEDTPEMNTQDGRTALAFLRWLKDNDIGIGLCHLHAERSSPRSERELYMDEWIALIEEWERDK